MEKAFRVDECLSGGNKDLSVFYLFEAERMKRFWVLMGFANEHNKLYD